MLYHTHTAEQTLRSLEANSKGLSESEAKRRLTIYGRNEMKLHRKPLWKIIIEPFANVFMLVLGVAAGLSILRAEPLDATIILIIMIANAVIFYIQTYSTQRVLRTLEKKNTQKALTLRSSKEVQIETALLVPGDIVLLSEGEKIPADGRILTSSQLRTNESQLTGESVPVSKNEKQIKSEVPIYERTNMVYQGSFVVSGTASFVITQTGNKTEFGTIASLVKKDSLVSPIQKKIDKLLTQIITVVLAIAAVAFGLALFRGMEVVEALSFVMALTVSAVPESLPVAISVVLVFGMRRMAAKKALVQTMRSIETIGAVTTIATDKTGTLTRNKLHLETTWQPKSSSVDLASYAEKTISVGEHSLSDPLDIAIETYAQEEGIKRSSSRPFVSFTFNQELSMSGNIWHHGKDYTLHVKGAPELIMRRSTLNADATKEATNALNELTAKGYRVIAIAHAPLKQPFSELSDIPDSLKLEVDGFIAVADQLRPEAKKAIASALQAGVSVRMITGDHLETAYFIGKKLGMVERRDQIFDSRSMDTMTDEELEKTIRDVRVFARVVPEQKYRILTILKKHNITAMTGDGVNDVPALSGAHVGLAMGSGSHIARDAGDIILLDDNFKTIIDALREGRTIISNVRRMLFYLLSTNAGEMMVMIGSLLMGIPLPLVPVQILWVNLVTDSCMVIPLGLEPQSKNVLRRKPSSPTAAILPRSLIFRMILMAVTMAVLTLGSFIYFLQSHGVDYARTVAFHVLVVMQLAAAFAARSDYTSAFVRLRTWSTPFYIGLLITIALHAFTLFSPLGAILHMSTLSVADLLITGAIAFIIPLLVSELHKLYGRRTAQQQ